MAGCGVHVWNMDRTPKCFLNPPDFWLVILADLESNNNPGFNRDKRKICAIGNLGKQKIRLPGYFLMYLDIIDIQLLLTACFS